MENIGSYMDDSPEPEPAPVEPEIDPVWTSSRTARQIYALGEVEKDISRLLAVAASAVSLLALPQTDDPGDSLPQGDERSEQFVLEATEYFERLDSIQEALRASLAHIRQSRISPRAITAPQPGAIPPTLGVGLPSTSADRDGRLGAELGLQEARVARNAWRNMLDALKRLNAPETANGDISMLDVEDPITTEGTSG